MFDKMFGWKKASTCKKLIKRLQCRLKVLKNKRCSIVKQIQEDVAQLLIVKQIQEAYRRVEQIYIDERIAVAYDLLDNFCELIILQLPYIRKHKYCPNDINEAVSSLVFASARCGDIPELLMVRSLFGERYGQRFTQVALDLLPGNLVNVTVRENLSIQSVPVNVKHYMLDEIARTSCVEPEPLALDYTSEWQQQQPVAHCEIQENKGEIVPCNEIYGGSNIHEESQLQASNVTKDEEGKKIVCVDIPSEEQKNEKEQLSRKLELVEEYTSESSVSDYMPVEDMLYVDDVEEFQSPMNKGGTIHDQSVFVFKPSIVPTSKKIEVKAGSRNTKNRTVSWDNRIFSDTECANYYGTSRNQHSKSHHPSEDLTKVRKSCYAKVDHPSDEMVSYCSLEKSCYLSACDDKDDSQSLAIHQINMFPCSCNEAPIKEEGGFLLVPLSMHKKIIFFDDLVPNKQTSQLTEKSEKVTEKREKKQHYARAMTIPPERPKDNQNDNLVRSNTFPLDRLSNASFTSSFVHPKLPDYDDLAAKFMALKKEALQKKQQDTRQ